MSFRKIKVLYIQAGAHARLEVESPVEIAGPGEIVVWELHNLPADSFAEVNFQSDGGFAGPFETLATGERRLLGLGKSPNPGGLTQFSYGLTVQQFDPNRKKSKILARSDELLLIDKREASLVTSRVTVEAGNETNDLRVTPDHAMTCVGAPMCWDFGAALERVAGEFVDDPVYRPRVLFTSGPHGSVLGPYSGLASDGSLITAVDRPDQRGGHFHYDVQIELVSGTILRLAANVDPVIDDEGDPPSTVIGEEDQSFARRA